MQPLYRWALIGTLQGGPLCGPEMMSMLRRTFFLKPNPIDLFGGISCYGNGHSIDLSEVTYPLTTRQQLTVVVLSKVIDQSSEGNPGKLQLEHLFFFFSVVGPWAFRIVSAHCFSSLHWKNSWLLLLRGERQMCTVLLV